MSRLNKADYLSHAEDVGVGEQIHVNHTNCSAGEDTKRRLYIRRTDDGSIVAYCHHCSQSGYYREDERRYRTLESTFGSSQTITKRSVQLPRDSQSDTGAWPPKAKVWLYRYGITDEEIKRHGIVYSNDLGRVILPVYNGGNLVGYQARQIFDDGKEKYLTQTTDPSRMVWYTSNTTSSSAVCFCEDILSAIRVGRRMSSCALLGTNLKDEVLNQIISKHDEFYIFLDDDNRQVVMSQIALKNKLELFGTVHLIKGVGKDPKECTDTELQEILG